MDDEAKATERDVMAYLRGWAPSTYVPVAHPTADSALQSVVPSPVVSSPVVAPPVVVEVPPTPAVIANPEPSVDPSPPGSFRPRAPGRRIARRLMPLHQQQAMAAQERWRARGDKASLILTGVGLVIGLIVWIVTGFIRPSGG